MRMNACALSSFIFTPFFAFFFFFFFCLFLYPQDNLKAVPAVLQLPIGSESDFIGVVDLVAMTVSRRTLATPAITALYIRTCDLRGHLRLMYDEMVLDTI